MRVGRALSSLLFVCACACTCANVASARDMSGEAALGGSYETGPAGPALSFRYWVSDLGLQLLYGMDTIASGSGEGEVGHIELRPSARGIYALTRTRLTNLFVGVGVAGVIRRDETHDKHFWATAHLETLIGAELFFSEKVEADDPEFSVCAQVTLSFEISAAATRSFDNPGWGAAFHYYF